MLFGADDEFEALAFGRQHQNTLDYLSNSFSNINETFKYASNDFIERAKNIYNRFNSSEALNFARNVRSKYFKKEDILDETFKLDSLNEIQNCSPFNQRFIMANPYLREEWYFNNRIDGYSDTYINIYGKVSGEDHYDYRRATDGLVTEELPDITIYFEELHQNDKELSLSDQMNILHNWNLTNLYLEKGKYDPTSKDGNEL